MDESKALISGSRLIEYWGIEMMDLFFLMINHNLTVLDQDSSPVGIEDVFQNYIKDENFDIPSLTFRLSDFKRIQRELWEQFKAMKTELMRGKEWMTSCGRGDAEIYNFITVHGLGFFDPAGKSIDDYWLIRFFSDQKKFKMADLLFRRSDVDALEEKLGLPGPKKIPDKKKEERWSELQRRSFREAARKVWEQDPTETIEGMMGRDELLEFTKKKDGSFFINKTLRDWIKDLCPDRKPGRRKKKE
jgi:hypothetical protein